MNNQKSQGLVNTEEITRSKSNFKSPIKERIKKKIRSLLFSTFVKKLYSRLTIEEWNSFVVDVNAQRLENIQEIAEYKKYVQQVLSLPRLSPSPFQEIGKFPARGLMIDEYDASSVEK